MQQPGFEQDRQKAAQRLLQQIQDSLSDTIVPAQAISLMILKNISQEEILEKTMISIQGWKDWVSGSAPALPSRKMNLLGLVLGVERASLTCDRVHSFTLNESNISKDRLSQHLDEIMPLLQGSVRSVITDGQGAATWKDGARIYALQTPKGAHVVITHIQKSRFGSQPVIARLQMLEWANHGRSTNGEKSELIASASLSDHLREYLPCQNNSICESIRDCFDNVTKTKENQGLMSLKERLVRPR